MKKVEIEVYDFKELNQKVQDKIINEYVRFLMDTTDYEDKDDPMTKAYQKSEKMQTPWFCGEIFYHDFGGKEIVEQEVNQHLYFKNGDIYE